MSFTQFLAKSLLDHLSNKTVFTAPGTIYIGLSSTTPNETGGNINEQGIGTNNYARVVTVSGDWNTATDADPSVLNNLNPATFPQALTGDWVSGANMTHFFLINHSTAAPSSTNVLAFGALTTAKPVLSGDTAEFAATDLTITLD